MYYQSFNTLIITSILKKVCKLDGVDVILRYFWQLMVLDKVAC